VLLDEIADDGLDGLARTDGEAWFRTSQREDDAA